MPYTDPKIEIQGKAQSALKQADNQAKKTDDRMLPTVAIKRCPTPTSEFTGREDLIQQIATCITETNKGRQVCVVHGPKGAGKTQLVLKAIEQHQATWTHVLFVDSSSRESIQTALQGFAELQNIGNNHKDTLNWLEIYPRPWLIVFDNMNDLSPSIEDYFPGGNYGSIIITTRRAEMIVHARGSRSAYHVAGMNSQEAFTLLLRVARRQDRVLHEQEIEAAGVLLQDLGNLPLAVVYAGVYLEHSPEKSIHTYRNLFLNERQLIIRLYANLNRDAGDYEKSACTAWKMCYDLLEKASNSRLLLWLIAFLYHNGITEMIFQQAAVDTESYMSILLPGDIGAAAYDHVRDHLKTYMNFDGSWNSTRFSGALRELSSYSLIEYNSVNMEYRINTLVQEWTRAIVPQPPNFALDCTTTLLIRSVNSKHDSLLGLDNYRQAIALHVGEVLSQLRTQITTDHQPVIFAQVLDAYQQLLGVDHPDTIAFMNTSAITYYQQDRWVEAELLQKQALDSYRRLLGEEHPYTLDSMYNLAVTYQKQGYWDKAEALQSRILDVRRRILGKEHPLTLSSIIDLVSMYRQQGKWEKARQLQSLLLYLRKKTLGVDHPDTLKSMNTLASILQNHGEWDEAEQVQMLLMNISHQVFGREHQNTLASMNNLAMTYYYQCQWDDAEQLQRQILNIHKRTLGEEHPGTLNSMSNLADTFWQQGKFQEAETLLIWILNAQERVLGHNHRDTLNTLVDLASTYSMQGRWIETEELENRVLETRKRLYGEKHLDVIASMDNLVHIFSKQGRLDKIEAILVQILLLSKETLGSNHPKTLKTKASLAQLYTQQDRIAEAEQSWMDIVLAAEQIFGIGDESMDDLICTATEHLVRIHQASSRLLEVEPTLLSLLRTSQDMLGNGHPTTLAIMNQLSEIYQAMIIQESPSYYGQSFRPTRGSANGINTDTTEIERFILSFLEMRIRYIDNSPPNAALAKIQFDLKIHELQPPPNPSKKIIISSTMPPEEVILHLTAKSTTCNDITNSVDEPSCDAIAHFGGSFGDVYRGRLKDKAQVALKCIRKLPQRIDQIHQYAARELRIWSKLKHDNILELLGLALFRNQIAMVSPWMSNGNLPHYLALNPTADRCELCTQIANGLAYMHEIRAVHGDLKASNVFISEEGVAKIGDFGSALKADATATMQFTMTTLLDNTLRWTAPELLMGESKLTRESDVYALGMTILEVISGKVPYSDKQDVSILHVVTIKKQMPVRSEESFPESSECGNSLWDLLLELWDHNPRSRPTAKQVYIKIKSITPDKLLPR